MVKRYELSDEDWTVVADLFIEIHGRARPRLMLDGVLWVFFSGAVWWDMLERSGPWSTVYQRFRGWRNQGTFDQMFKCFLGRLACDIAAHHERLLWVDSVEKLGFFMQPS